MEAVYPRTGSRVRHLRPRGEIGLSLSRQQHEAHVPIPVQIPPNVRRSIRRMQDHQPRRYHHQACTDCMLPLRVISNTEPYRHNNYFETFSPIMPILSKDRFFKRIKKDQGTPQVQALSYSVALIGAAVSPEHNHLKGACLSMVRRCIEVCERDEDMPMMLSLDLFQALLFITRF